MSPEINVSMRLINLLHMFVNMSFFFFLVLVQFCKPLRRIEATLIVSLHGSVPITCR